MTTFSSSKWHRIMHHRSQFKTNRERKQLSSTGLSRVSYHLPILLLHILLLLYFLLPSNQPPPKNTKKTKNQKNPPKSHTNTNKKKKPNSAAKAHGCPQPAP
jgi:hypothetical protein